MKVYGVEITAEQIAAADAVIFSGKPFTCIGIAMAISHAGVTDWTVANRAADRHLQKHRKSGSVCYLKERLCWVVVTK